MISSEANPLYKTGGLGDVIYSLSRKMSVYKHRVYIALPYYKNMLVEERRLYIEHPMDLDVMFNGVKKRCQLHQVNIDNITFLLFKNVEFFGRDQIYGYEDDKERFAYFNVCVLEYLKRFKVGFDVIHCNDWHSAMIPYLMKRKITKKFTRNPKFVLTIHNPVFMGYMKEEIACKYYSLDSIEKIYVNNYGDISTLKMGIVNSDWVTTVSPTHAKELLTDAKLFNLDDVLIPAKEKFSVILNGIDTKEFNPDKDLKIALTYNKENVISHKIINKKNLINLLHLQNSDRPLFGCVCRVSSQKGVDLIANTIEQMIENNCNFVFLGKGDKELEQQLLAMDRKYPHNVSINLEYSDSLAHQIYASSDFFLMPSKFEPCGISQMIAMRYGTLPIVREVGGLKDTVIPYNGFNEDKATGLSFYEFSSNALWSTIKFALRLYSKKRIFSKLVHNALDQDNSWTNSYFEYLSIYQKICSK